MKWFLLTVPRKHGAWALLYSTILLLRAHVFQAMHGKFGAVSLVHFDSHFDTWDEYFGEKCTHGTPFKRVRTNPLLLPA